MPHIEHGTQITMRTLNGGRPNGVSHERKTGGNEGIYIPVSKGNQKTKPVVLNEFTRLTGNPRSGF
jgi:hypothetical protein